MPASKPKKLRAAAVPVASAAHIKAPLTSLQWVPRDSIYPNDYNPNTVLEHNLDLLTRSILSNGWTLPIVIRPDRAIIDGFHRWTIAGREPLLSMLGGQVPVVTVDHGDDPRQNIVGTITHNRARGVHLLEPMKAIIKRLLDDQMTPEQIAKDMGMKVEEVYRLAPLSRDDFLRLMHKDTPLSIVKHRAQL